MSFMPTCMMSDTLDNPHYYLELLKMLEKFQRVGNLERETEIMEEMDAVWEEMTPTEKEHTNTLIQLNN